MNPLYNVLPPQARKFLYAALFVAGLVFSIYQATEGDWKLFVGSLLTAFLGLLASSNTYPVPPPAPNPDVAYNGER